MLTWRALRKIVIPLLREIAGESARVFLKPCCLVMFWQRRAIKLRLRGRAAGFASWRYRVNRDKCAALDGGGGCNADEAADKVLASLIEAGSPAFEEFGRMTVAELARVIDLLGTDARKAAAKVINAAAERGSLH